MEQESFDRFMRWLHPDREMAGKKYEEIRSRLIRILVKRGCNCAEELADETITRVIGKIHMIADTYEGDPALYFYGVMNKVFLEYTRNRTRPLPLLVQNPLEDIDRDYECLEECVNKLNSENRKLICEYYQDDKRAKINHRKQLAERLGISAHTLRMRAHRLKVILRECILDCLKREVI